MKKILLLAAAVILLLLSGCFADTEKVALGEEFSLKIGESASMRGENLEITFLEVLEDSRCPKNVTCIWAGRARSLIKVTIDGQSEDIELVEPAVSDETNWYRYSGYRIDYSLFPYPENAGEFLNYYLLLTISLVEAP